MTTTIYTTGQSVPATLTVAAGDTVIFQGSASAGASRITNAGTVRFEDASTAASATITTTSGGKTQFVGNSTAGGAGIGGATLIASSGGIVDLSGTTGALGDHKVSAGSLSGAGTFYLGANEVTVGGGNASTTVSGVIADSAPSGGGGTGGSLVKAGTGTLTLSGTNTLSGGIKVIGGTLTVAGDASLGSASSVLTLDGGTLATTVSTPRRTLTHAIVLGADGGTLGNLNRVALTGGISGTGGLTVNGSGMVTLLGTNSYTGGTTITSGVLALGTRDSNALRSTGFGNVAATITGAITNNAALVILNADLRGVPGISTTAGATTDIYQAVPAGVALSTVAGATVDLYPMQNQVPLTEAADFEGPGTYFLGTYVTAVLGNPVGGSPISGTFVGGDGYGAGGELIKQGTGTLVFAGGSVGVGLTIQSGRIQFGTTLEGTLSGTPGQSESASGLIDNFAQFDVVNSNGPGGHLEASDGLTTESGARTDFYNLSDAGSTVLNVAGGGVVDFSRSRGPKNDGVVQAAALAGAGTVNLGSNQLELVYLADSRTFSGSLNDGGAAGGTGASIRVGAGVEQTFSGASTYTGGTFIDGTLRVTSDAALGAASGGLTFDGGTLYTTSNLSPARSVTLKAGGGTLNFGDIGTFVIKDISGVGHLTKEGAATVILEATAYTGGTTNGDGSTLQVGTTASGAKTGSGGTTGTLSGAVVNDATLDIVNADTSNLTSLTAEGKPDRTIDRSTYDPDTYVKNSYSNFYNMTSAGQATINLNWADSLNFYDDSSAGNASIRSHDSFVNFYDRSTAGTASLYFPNTTFNQLDRYAFHDDSSAGSADFYSGDGGGALEFYDNASAGTAYVRSGYASRLKFEDHSTAGNATLDLYENGIYGSSYFSASFEDNSSGGSAALILGYQSRITFAGTGPNGDYRNSLGSLTVAGEGFISGYGNVGRGVLNLGATILTVGSDNLSTTVAGTVLGSGSIAKIGTGTLTMSGGGGSSGSEYSGGTTIEDGTIDLASSGGIGSGAVTFAGSLGHVATLAIEAGVQLSNGGTFANGLTDFGDYDVLDLKGLTYTLGATAIYDPLGHLLTISSGGKTENFTMSGSVAPLYFAHSDGHGGTIIDDSLACYAAGTLILTDTGEIAVEALAAGDHVITASGERRPIVWVGSRRVDTARHPRPELVRPVRIAAGALGEGLPLRDLVLSPEHALWLGDALVPARDLVNGATIRQEAWSRVDYVHVELETHDILLAEGVPAESYLDCDNRLGFDNAPGGVVALHPDWGARAAGRPFASLALTARLKAAFAARASTMDRAAELRAYETVERARARATRTNVVRNPRAEGAHPGRIGGGGRAPTHWWFDASDGIVIEVVGSGGDNGLPFLDLRLVGRADAGGHVALYPEPGIASSAAPGQDWTMSCHLRLMRGRFDGVGQVSLYVDEYAADGAYLTGEAYPQPRSTTDDLSLQRLSATRRIAGRDAAAMTAYVRIEIEAGAPIDVTLRLAAPQIERGGYASDLMLPPQGEMRAAMRQGRDRRAMADPAFRAA